MLSGGIPKTKAFLPECVPSCPADGWSRILAPRPARQTQCRLRKGSVIHPTPRPAGLEGEGCSFPLVPTSAFTERLSSSSFSSPLCLLNSLCLRVTSEDGPCSPLPQVQDADLGNGSLDSPTDRPSPLSPVETSAM